MTDQERPSDPATPPEGSTPPEGTTPESTPPEPPAVGEPDQPTVGWTPPGQPTGTPAPSGWGAGQGTPPPAQPPAGPPPGAWGSPPSPPPAQPPAGPSPGSWGSPPPPPPPSASGPLISASPAPSSGWTQPTFGQREVAPGLVFSGTAARFVAYLIDGFLLAIVASVVSAIFGVSTFASRSSVTPGELAQAQFGVNAVIATIVSVVINGAYFIAFWSGGRRATLGQMLLSIQVGNAFDGKPLTTTQAVKRWFALGEFLQAFSFSFGAAAALGALGLVWSLVLFITTATSPTKQGLHDRFANSAVVRPIGASNAIVWGCLILFVILPLLAIVALIFIGGQISSQLSMLGESV
jgi:uncharacterized RDD family membrane protein YckC